MVPSLMASPHANRPRAQGHSRISLILTGRPGDRQGAWVDQSADPKVREAGKDYSEALTALTDRQAKAFAKGVPTARVVTLPGAHHYVYLSSEVDVLREMRAFLTGLH
jgi:pimeloyl-ACP methyl ester carboxylesterase